MMVIPFGRMTTDLSASDMQAKSNEYNRFISQQEKPMEFIIAEMGDFVRRSVIVFTSIAQNLFILNKEPTFTLVT